MQAGDGLRNEPPYGEPRAVAQGLGELIHRQGGGGNVRLLRGLLTAGQKQRRQKQQRK